MKHLKTFESYSINEENIFKNIALSILKKIPKFKEGFENAKTKLEQDSKLKSDLEKFKDSNLKELQEIQNKIGSDLENLDFATNEEANIMGSLTKYFPKLGRYFPTSGKVLGKALIIFVPTSDGDGTWFSKK
jgi:hypothetical protein